MAGWRLEGGVLRHRELAALGLPHGVTTRTLGDMRDAASRAKSVLPAASRLRSPRQVHGRRVVRWGEGGERPPEGDAMITDRPGTAVGILVADCAPVFVWERSGGAVGLAHMGWRGAAQGVVRALVEALVLELGVEPSELRAAVGPHISACCFEVGPEVAGLFPAEARAFRHPDGRPRVDLGAAARLQLAEAGLPEAELDVLAPCTACESGSFFSYRREKAEGRMLAFLGL